MLSFTGAGSVGKLVGRAAELERMAEVLASVQAGAAGAVAVVGEPGIGKTRMLGQLCERATATGFELLSGCGSEFEREVPFGLVVDALDQRFRALDAEVVAKLGPDRYAELAVVLPSLAGRGTRLASRLEVERFEFHRAVRTVFEQLVSARPLLLTLDDVHWADPASVELIGFLLRRPVPGMLLALGYRPRAPRLLHSAVQQAARESLLRELTLSPLTIGEAAELLGQRSDSPLTRSLHAESGGNPFYLEQLARTAHDEPTAPIPRTRVGDEHQTGIPAAVRVALDQELAVLGSDALEVLRAAAVAGDPFDVELVAEIMADDKIPVLERLDALVAADLVRATDVAGWLRFRHPIVRRVVYDSALPGWLFSAHKRAAGALTRRGAPLSARAHHVAQSATVGDQQAITTLMAAGKAATRAPAAAAGWFEAALRLLPETSGPEQRLPLMTALADALAYAGRLRDSRTILEHTLAYLPGDWLADRARIIRMIIRADHGLGRAEEARHMIITALEHTPIGSADSVTLLLDHAENHLMMGRWARAVETAAAARRQAQTLGEPSLLLAATATLAWCSSLHSTVAETRELVDRAAVAMDARDVDLTPALLYALADLSLAEWSIDRFRDVYRHAERGLRVSRIAGHGYLHGRFTLAVGVARLFLGQLSDAKSDAESAIEVAALLDNDQLHSAAEGLRCWIETERGDLSAALAAGRAAVRASRRQPHALFAWFAHAAYGEALIEADEPEQGRQEILSIGGPELTGIPPAARSVWHQSLVTAELAAGRIEAAQAVARRMEQGVPGLGSGAGNARFAQARIDLARCDFQSAAASAHQAVKCFDAVEMRVWAGRARLVAGRAHALAGERAAAVGELELAHRILHDAGAERLRDEAAKCLRGLGIRVRRQPVIDEPVEAPILTEREQDIADRVVQGYTNREIAAQLFVSPKTVEKHLARIFTKLGISSRAGVAAALNRQQTGIP
ncbi:helix-turn-helix transcriptional regulator [Nocardia abscessus]|uniref:helix-turn-helix transcriptional regulator n=1 Tax=Nocardia abscessus TaxID=120957 RepID=UPI002456832B|nr:LuxR family transcriptional regulator [Nocardia abscessus]